MMRRAGCLFLTPGLQRKLVAFQHVFPSAFTLEAKRRNVVEGRNLALETRQLKFLPAILILSTATAGFLIEYNRFLRESWWAKRRSELRIMIQRLKMYEQP